MTKRILFVLFVHLSGYFLVWPPRNRSSAFKRVKEISYFKKYSRRLISKPLPLLCLIVNMEEWEIWYIEFRLDDLTLKLHTLNWSITISVSFLSVNQVANYTWEWTKLLQMCISKIYDFFYLVYFYDVLKCSRMMIFYLTLQLKLVKA